VTRPNVYLDLPQALFDLVPELDTVRLDSEPRADCGNCVRVAAHYGGDPEKPWAFDPKVHCCTFQPSFPNVLVGRSLRRGGPGAARMKARIAERRDMAPWGLYAGKAFDDAYAQNHHRFGRAVELTCPMWSGETLGCGVWPDRPPVCRTWHCKHTRGDDGMQQWGKIRRLLDLVLHHVALACVAAGRPPLDTDPDATWEAWYVWCADWVDAHAGGLRGLLRSADVERHVQKMLDGAGPPGVIPDVVIPSLTHWERDGDRLYLLGYSTFDGIRAPLDVFAFLALLDGRTPWREALARANETLSERLPESFVEELFRVGGVRSPLDSDHPIRPIAVPT